MTYQGRVYTIEDLERFLAYYKNDPNISRCARKAGIKGGWTTVKRLRGEFKWFDEKINEIYDQALDDAEEFIVKKARKNVGAAKFLLTESPRGRKRGYGKKIELTGEDGKPISWKQVIEKSAIDDSESSREEYP